MCECVRFGDLNVYFSDLYLRCASINDAFGEYFESLSVNMSIEMGIECSVRNAPVKGVDRCIEKSETDYHDRLFPTSAHIIDINRCSFTFPNPNQLIRGYQFMIQLFGTQNETGNDDESNFKVLKVVRIKNGFKKCSSTKKEMKYTDLKMNIHFGFIFKS